MERHRAAHFAEGGCRSRAAASQHPERRVSKFPAALPRRWKWPTWPCGLRARSTRAALAEGMHRPAHGTRLAPYACASLRATRVGRHLQCALITSACCRQQSVADSFGARRGLPSRTASVSGSRRASIQNNGARARITPAVMAPACLPHAGRPHRRAGTARTSVAHAGTAAARGAREASAGL